MATLKDIAIASGVSTATVSYVVNDGPRPVLPATRERVLKVIAELGYHPNAAARSLMGKRTHTFGVVFPHVVAAPFDNEYFALVLAGIIDAATERKQIAMLFTGMSWREVESNLPLFCDGRCDGFLFVAPPPGSGVVAELTERNKHVVLLGTDACGLKVATIDSNNVEGSRIATRHLLDMGHRRIAMFQGHTPSTSTAQREEGFRLAFSEAGIPIENALFVPDRKPTETSVEVAHRVLTSPAGKELTAIVCAHDAIARDAVTAGLALGRRVPEDLSVVGFDDLPLAAHVSPPLTTIRQPLRQIGAKAGHTLFDLIEDPTTQPSQRLFDVQLIERGSTAPPRRSS